MNIIKDNKLLKNVLCIVLSYLATLSFSKLLKLGKSDDELFSMLDHGVEFLYIFIFGIGIAVISRFIKLEDKRIKIGAVITGFSLSLLTVWGAYALFINDIFISGKVAVTQILMMLGLSLLLIPAVAEVYLVFGKIEQWYGIKKENVSYTRKNNVLYYLIVWIGIFVCFIPVFLCAWPGNFIYDAQYQLSEVINNAYKTHHPLLHTWLMGKAYRIGLEWGNVSKGFQLYTLFQMLVLSSSFAFCLLYFRKKGVPRLFRVITFIFFGLFPLNTIFSITATKDVLFAAFFLYTMIFFIRFFCEKEKFHWYTYVAMISFGVLSALFRNNAIYALMVFGFIAIIVVKGLREKGKVLVIVLGIYFLTNLCNNLLIDGLNAYPGFKNRESLSLPLQGLARVASYHGDELYEYEYNEICMYIKESTIKNYIPINSDPIKNEANEELLENNKLNFFKLWAKIGIQYPDEYVESFVSNTMGYWYLFPMKDYVTMKISLYHTLIGTEHEIEKVRYWEWSNEMYQNLFVGSAYKYSPLIGYLFRAAPYIWLMLFSVLWNVIRKNRNAVFGFVLPLLYFGTCLLGPTVAIRYVYCLIVCCPIWLMLSCEKR